MANNLPAAVTGPKATAVAGARPGFSAFPLQNIASGATGKDLQLNSLDVKVQLPGSELIRFNAGAVSAPPGTEVEITIEGSQLLIRFWPSSITLTIDFRDASAIDSLLAQAFTDVSTGDFNIQSISYDFNTQQADAAVGNDSKGFIRQKIKEAVEKNIRVTALGVSGYSLLRDPDPISTLAKSFTQLKIASEQQDQEALSSAFLPSEESISRELSTVTSPLKWEDFVLSDVEARFTTSSGLSLPSKTSGRSLELVPNSSLRVVIPLRAKVGTLTDRFNSGAPWRSLLPVLGVSALIIRGRINVASQGKVLASFSELRIDLDGQADIRDIEIQPAGMPEGAPEAINIDRALNSLLAASLVALRALSETKSPEVFNLPPVQQDLARSLVLNNKSTLVEPVLQAQAKKEIDAALTEEIQDLLKGTVEKLLGAPLREIFTGTPRLKQ